MSKDEVFYQLLDHWYQAAMAETWNKEQWRSIMDMKDDFVRQYRAAS